MPKGKKRKGRPVAKVTKAGTDGVETGLYSLTSLRQLIRDITKAGVTATITLPRSWCRESSNVPLLSPEALRYIDLLDAPDTKFKKPDMFVVEVGRKKYTWG